MPAKVLEILIYLIAKGIRAKSGQLGTFVEYNMIDNWHKFDYLL